MSLSEAEIREAFSHFDADNSGSISASEIHKALGELGVQISQAEAAEAVKEFDKDGTGQLSFNEFVQLIRTIEGAAA